MFCKYKNIFGEPNHGVHAYRFVGVAIVDVVMTILAAFLIAYAIKQPVWLVTTILFILGIIAHRLFCVRTTVDKVLFPNAA
jgi:ABC-type spermidine/putrescine transport system permease subunit I